MKFNKKLVFLSLLLALELVLILCTRFPLFTAFLEYEAGDVPVLIASMLFGPWYGLLLVVLGAALQSMTISAQSGWFGFAMHVLASGALAVTVGLIFRPTKKVLPSTLRLFVGLVCGTLAMAAVMYPANLFLDPIFYHMTTEQVRGMLPVIVAFNLVKAGINCALAGTIYFLTGKYLRRFIQS